jgi:hypothetical protein
MNSGRMGGRASAGVGYRRRLLGLAGKQLRLRG